MKICELKIKSAANMNSIVLALSSSGYTVRTSVVWKEFPQSGVDYFMLAVFDTDGKGDCDG